MSNKSELYLQTPFGIEQNDALIERVAHTLETGKVSALLCHNPALVDHFAVKLGLADKTSYMLPYPNEGTNELHPHIEGWHCFSIEPATLKNIKKTHKNMSVGVGPTGSVDDALEWGEVGADYVAFAASETEAMDWWMRQVILPCVAWGANSLDHVETLIEKEVDLILPAPIFWQKDATDLNRLLALF